MDIHAAAAALLESNFREGADPHLRVHYRYVCPSRHKYPWQWYWDSCFHAIALAHVRPEMAAGELESLLASQRPDGFIAHVTYWSGAARAPLVTRLESRLALRPRRSELIQPPLLAQAVERVYQLTGDLGFLERAYPRLVRHYRWLAENRCPDGDGLIVLISPFESGMDNTPAYDPALGISSSRPGWWSVRLRVARLHVSHLVSGANYDLGRIYRLGHFSVKDVAVNCIYAEALRALSRIASALGHDDDQLRWQGRGVAVEKAIVETFFDPGSCAFLPTYGPERLASPSLTAATLLALLLESLPTDISAGLVERHLANPDRFWTEYPVPSVALSEPSFSPDPGEGKHPLIWRGPTWININWFIARGLRRHGFVDLATRIEQRSADLVEKSGFREFYHPHTGAGQGARDFAWSTLAVDMSG